MSRLAQHFMRFFICINLFNNLKGREGGAVGLVF